MNFLKTNFLGLLVCLTIAVPSYFLGKLIPIIGGPVFAILRLQQVLNSHPKRSCSML